MKFKKTLAPGFLQRFDKWLLLNKPDTWSARTHWVLYYSFLFALALSVICFYVPDDPRKDSPVYVWCFMVGILSIIGFIFWCIYLLRYNVFKKFGPLHPIDKVKSFLLYFIAIAAMVLVVFIPPLIESIRANKAYSNDELVRDVNTMNLDLTLLNKDSIPRKWNKDSVIVRDTLPNSRHQYNLYTNGMEEVANTVIDSAVTTVEPHEGYVHYIDTLELRTRIQGGDSAIKIADTIYLFFTSKDYQFIHLFTSTEYDPVNSLLQSKEIYYQVFKSNTPFNREAKEKELKALLSKYYVYKNFRTDDGQRSTDYFFRVRSRANAYAIERTLENISRRKFRWTSPFLPGFIRVFYYTTLCIALLVFIFRQTTVKTFFLTLLTMVLLLILHLIFAAFFNISSKIALILLLIYFLIFALITIWGLYRKTQLSVTGVALNIIVTVMPFVPLLLTSLYFMLERERWSRELNEMGNFSTIHQNEALYSLYAEFIGAALLLLMIGTVFHRLYRKWIALPEQ